MASNSKSGDRNRQPIEKERMVEKMFSPKLTDSFRESADKIESAMAFLNDVAVVEVEPAVIGSSYTRQQQPLRWIISW